MDATLAEMYGTNKTDESDAEILATAAFAEKLASADELNIDSMSDEEAEALAAELIGDDEPAAATEPETEEAAAEEPSEEPDAEKTAEAQKVAEAQEKLAEADFLGRAMAHAFVSEHRKIASAARTKTAAKKGDKGKVMEHVKKAGVVVKKASAEATEPEEAKVSALDQLAAQRAVEILKENGIEPEQEKKSSISDEKAELLAQKVQARALELLKAEGYEIQTEEAPVEE